MHSLYTHMVCAIAEHTSVGGPTGMVSTALEFQVGGVAGKVVFKGAVYAYRARVAQQAAKGAGSAFKIAQSGGKHAGFLKNYLGRSPAEINKAINSLQAGKRGINVHLDKLANPSKYVPNWNTLRSGHQQSLIRGWQNEITNGRQQIDILRGILGN